MLSKLYPSLVPTICRNFCFSSICLLLIISSCQNEGTLLRKEKSQQWFTENGKVKALATTAMVADLVNAIGADHVDTLTLITGQLDPHSYQMVKGDDEKFSFAQLIFYNGLGLEHGPSLATQLENTDKAIALGNYILDKNPSKIFYFHGTPDPHIWMDLTLWSEAIPHVVEALSKQDPTHANEYLENGKKARENLLSASQRIRQILSSVPEAQRYLVTSHDAFNYFARAYLATEEEAQSDAWQERFTAPEGLAPESQISGVEIHAVIDYLKKHNIHVIFPESNVSKDSLRKIVDAGSLLGLTIELATTPLYGDAMGPAGSGADSHPAMIEYNAEVIARALR